MSHPKDSSKTPDLYEVERTAESAPPQWVVRVHHGPYVSYHYTEENARHTCDMLNEYRAESATRSRLVEALDESTALLERAAAHVPANAASKSMMLTKPISECRTLDHIEAQIKTNAELLSAAHKGGDK